MLAEAARRSARSGTNNATSVLHAVRSGYMPACAMHHSVQGCYLTHASAMRLSQPFD